MKYLNIFSERPQVNDEGLRWPDNDDDDNDDNDDDEDDNDDDDDDDDTDNDDDDDDDDDDDAYKDGSEESGETADARASLRPRLYADRCSE